MVKVFVRASCVLFLACIPGFGQALGFLTGNGSIYVNGQQMTVSTAVMPGDVIQTKDAGVANLVESGSGVFLQANTIVRMQNGGLSLDRGTVSIATGKAALVLARDFKIAPTSTSWTQYDVIRSTGSIQVLARKNSITVSCGTAPPVLVKEGQQLSRPDSFNCGLTAKGSGAPPAATGPIITTATAQRAGEAAAAGLAAWALTQSDNPVSPSAP